MPRLVYRATFIAVQDAMETAKNRTQSLPPRFAGNDRDTPEHEYVNSLLQRRASLFGSGPSPSDCWDAGKDPARAEGFELEDQSGNDGSLGHPEVCGRPCVRFMHGNCEQGAACQFCHLEHTRPKGKLDKRQRQCFETLGANQVLKLLLPYILSRAREQGVEEAMVEVLALLRANVVPGTSVPRSKGNFLRVILKRLTVARLLELVVQNPQADVAFTAKLKGALARVRVAMRRAQ
mmetsp:Transcript_68145/g.160399  ORF Transcript_68145/g.160399 Transcript_68145/m.160399 type:complete len:235 (+) Transcript_68145:57-761(+)